jgi:arsenate reductase
MATIYYNGQCSKCRTALGILKDKGVDAQVVEYRTTPPTVAELERLSRQLGLKALGMMRTEDALMADLGLKATDQRSEREWFELIHENPMLLQRPIVVVGERAVIARPGEKVLELLG